MKKTDAELTKETILRALEFHVDHTNTLEGLVALRSAINTVRHIVVPGDK